MTLAILAQTITQPLILTKPQMNKNLCTPRDVKVFNTMVILSDECEV